MSIKYDTNSKADVNKCPQKEWLDTAGVYGTVLYFVQISYIQ